MAKYSTFEKLPVEIVELCLEGLPASSIGALLGLSRQTRHLVLTSIEFIFAKLLKKFDEKKQYVGLEVIHSSLSVTVRSQLTFSNFVSLDNVTTTPKLPLRYARFEIVTPMDVAAGESDAALFTCSVFRRDSDIPCRNFFEDISKVRDQNPIMVDRDGMLVNTAPGTSKDKEAKGKDAEDKEAKGTDAEGKEAKDKEAKDLDGTAKLLTVDINPLKERRAEAA